MGKRRQRHGSMELVDRWGSFREATRRYLRSVRAGVLPVPCSPDHCPAATQGPAGDEPECRCAQENEG
jgi:hypothetical protein